MAAAAGNVGLPDDMYNAIMLFEPNAIEIAMAELRRVLRAEARHASNMRKRAGKFSRVTSRTCSLLIRSYVSTVLIIVIRKKYDTI